MSIYQDPNKFLSHFTKQNQDKLMEHLEKMDILYAKGKPILPDYKYDQIKDMAYEMFPHNKYFKTVGAPTNENPKSKKVVLPNYMGSLDKIVKDGKPASDSSSAPFLLNKFLKTFRKGEFVIMDKLDGVSAAIYTNEEKNNTTMFTRGNGYVGQDISWILPYIRGVKHISTQYESVSSSHVLRGELVVSRVDFRTVNDQRANSRNMVAGLINSKTPDISLLRLIQFVPYTVIYPIMKPTDQMDFCIQNGYNPVYHSVHKGSDISVDMLSRLLTVRRLESEYDIDGIVITHNTHHEIETGRNPRHSIAFKQLDDTANVVVERVAWEASKNGLLKPVVHFQPTVLSGAKIQRATGINAKYIKDNKIGPGALIKISRSGEVIPKILEIIQPATQSSLPEQEYVWSKTGVDIIVDDYERNEDVMIKNMTAFFTTLKVPNLSSGNIKKFYNAGYSTVSSILEASEQQFQKTLGVKNGSSIYQAVQSLKDNPIDCAAVMHATNAFGHGFGYQKLDMILKAFPELIDDSSFVPSTSKLVEMNGISQITAAHFLEGLSKFRTFMVNHPSITCKRKKEKEQNDVQHPSPKLEDVVVLFTGFRDDALAKNIQRLGGTVATSFTKKVKILVYKQYNEKSQKIKQAIDSGTVKVMSVGEFQSFIKS